MTNYEKIKNMTAEEMQKALFELLWEIEDAEDLGEVFCWHCIHDDQLNCGGQCDKGVLAWLNSEVKE